MCEALYERYFRHLTAKDVLVDPSAGNGQFLLSIPEHLDSYGVEVDRALAELAAERSNKLVVIGDFRTVSLPKPPTALIGNPPFRSQLIEQFLARAASLLPMGGQVGFILPAYFLQTSQRIIDYTNIWSIESVIIPRDIFPRLSLPLIFSLFRKDQRRTLVGLALFEETAALRQLPRRFRSTIAQASRSVWLRVVEEALSELGGTGSLSAVYSVLENRRPTANSWWKEKTRQVLNAHPHRFERVEPGRYRLKSLDTIPREPLFVYA